MGGQREITIFTVWIISPVWPYLRREPQEWRWNSSQGSSHATRHWGEMLGSVSGRSVCRNRCVVTTRLSVCSSCPDTALDWWLPGKIQKTLRVDYENLSWLWGADRKMRRLNDRVTWPPIQPMYWQHMSLFVFYLFHRLAKGMQAKICQHWWKLWKPYMVCKKIIHWYGFYQTVCANTHVHLLIYKYK